MERKFRGEILTTTTKAIAAVKATITRKASILVVDDDRAIRELLRLHLTNVGYEVTEAPDAVVAGQLLIKNACGFDLLIVDAHLPYLTGLDFAAALIADTTLPPLPIVLITGHQELASRADVLDVPCLVKPFSVDTLLDLVKTTLACAPASVAELRNRDTAIPIHGNRRRA